MVRKKLFAAIVFDIKDKIFIGYKVFLVSFKNHPSHKCLIPSLKAKKAFIIILSENANFVNDFSLDLVIMLPKHT